MKMKYNEMKESVILSFLFLQARRVRYGMLCYDMQFKNGLDFNETRRNGNKIITGRIGIRSINRKMAMTNRNNRQKNNKTIVIRTWILRRIIILVLHFGNERKRDDE